MLNLPRDNEQRLVSTRLRMQGEEMVRDGQLYDRVQLLDLLLDLREHSAPDDPVYRDGRAFVAVKEFPAVPDPFLIYASSLAGPSRSGRLGHLVYLEALRRRSDLELQAYIGEVARVLRDCFPERGLDQDVLTAALSLCHCHEELGFMGRQVRRLLDA